MAGKTVEALFGDELARIRQVCHAEQCFSLTSPEYQSDVLNFIYENREEGGAIVEVGCYKGGLSALLSFMCKQFNLQLYSMDVNPAAIASAKGLLAKLGLDAHATIFHGPLPTFVSEVKLRQRPVLVNLDGDHAYPAVMADIAAVERMQPRPYAVSFHDFSLRHPDTDERVNEAIEASFGSSVPVKPIGMQMTGTGHATKLQPDHDGHYWSVPGSEGALVVMPDRPKRKPPGGLGFLRWFQRDG